MDIIRNLQRVKVLICTKENTIHELTKFLIRSQRHVEFVEEFVHNLPNKWRTAIFDKDDHILERLVVSVTDNYISEKLKLESELTLANTIENNQNSELEKNEVKDLHTQNFDAVRVQRDEKQTRTAADSKIKFQDIYVPDVTWTRSRILSCSMEIHVGRKGVKGHF